MRQEKEFQNDRAAKELALTKNLPQGEIVLLRGRAHVLKPS